MSRQPHIVIEARIRPASTGRPVDRLLEYLPEIDPETHYTVLLKPDDTWTTSAANITVRHTRFPIFSFSPLNQLLYARELRRLKPDLVFFTLTGQQPLGYFGRQITLTHDLTMYRFVRAGRLPGWIHHIRMVLYRLLMWAAHRKAQKIIVPSDYVKEDLSAFHRFTTHKIVRIYESSEPPISGKGKRPTGVGNSFILHVGSPLPHKNIPRLIEALKELHTTHPNLQLVLAGKREYFFEQLQRQIDASPARDAIIAPGFVSDAELKWLYEQAEAYVLPSESEGFGLPGLEAMAHGCPLVSSNATCLPEVYGDAAQYFDPLDVTDMAKQIGSVLGDKDLRKDLVERGHDRLKQFSWKTMATETVEVYRSVLPD
ncbi:glycosyltransferase family 1 protein [Patescibacteria group bacterium]|nr:MAG: glycosyltransferase family 1 protein [Patescibacteria group bacterium]